MFWIVQYNVKEVLEPWVFMFKLLEQIQSIKTTDSQDW